MYKLREIEKKDLQTINNWRNNNDLISCLGAPFRYINLETDERWFNNYMNNRQNTVRCSIVDNEDQILGLVSLTNIDYLNQSAEFHIMIGDSINQGRGIGSFATKKMLEHAFLNLNLHRVELDVLENNSRARHLYEKVGFVLEGVKRKAFYKNGDFANVCIYSILDFDYKKD